MIGIYVVQYPSCFIGLLYCKTGPTQSWVFKHAALIHTTYSMYFAGDVAAGNTRYGIVRPR